MSDPGATLQHLLRRVAANIEAAAAESREVIEVGPFRAFLSPTSDNRYMNYAVPTRVCGDWTGPLLELRTAFESRNRLMRFELLSGLWPTLPPALEAMGLGLEIAAPLMVLTPDELSVPPPSRARVNFLGADSPSEDFAAYYQVGADGFGMSLMEPLEVSEARDRPLFGGATRLAALARVDGTPVACGTLLRSGDVAELAGVATAPGWRRQGFAAHLCIALLEAAFAAGVTLVWLSAAEAGAVALYRALGFASIGEQLHMSLPER